MDVPPGTEIRDLRVDGDLALGRRFYDEVLRPSFQADELDPWETFEEGLRPGAEPVQRVAVAVDAEGTPLGGLTAELYSPSGVLLIGYLAVRPGWRGQGIGTLLMTSAAPQWYSDPSVVLALGEVHDPRHAWDVAGEDSSGRLRFFERCGARLLRVPFVQPSLGAGLNRVPHFLLVVFALKDGALVASDPPMVDARIVDSFVRGYYEACEGPLPDEPDPELARLLADLSGTSGIPVLPLGRYADLPAG